MLEKGNVVWVRFPPPRDSGPAGLRPAVVLQHDRFNRTSLGTTVVVPVTSNLRYAAFPGNVRLQRGEAGLPGPSLVNVTQIATVDRADLSEILGRLNRARLAEVRDGVRLVLAPGA